MAKFNIELDSDTNIMTFTIDGNPVSVNDVTIMKYECNEGGYDVAAQKYNIYCVNYSISNDLGESVTYCYRYSEKDLADDFSSPTMAKNLAKAAQLEYTGYKVMKALSKKSNT